MLADIACVSAPWSGHCNNCLIQNPMVDLLNYVDPMQGQKANPEHLETSSVHGKWQKVFEKQQRSHINTDCHMQVS